LPTNGNSVNIPLLLSPVPFENLEEVLVAYGNSGTISS
jgi:hypothetical protein